MISKSSIKDIQSLQQKKFRDQYGAFIAEGPKCVLELIESGTFPVKAVYGLSNWLNELAKAGINMPSGVVIEVSQEELMRISGFKTPNTCLAIFSMKENKEAVSTDSLILLLDEIQDPGNLGTMIRTADWFGVTQIICTPGTADCYNPKVVQSTMASLGRVNVFYIEPEQWLKQHPDKELICTSLQGVPFGNVKPKKNQVLVIGNEARGVSPLLLEKASRITTIPRRGSAESLNAAVATGILLAHFSGI